MTDTEASTPTPWLAFKGFEACILVNKIPVTRFGAEYKESTDEASAWIPSEANKTFVVHYRKTVQDEYGYCASLFLDGNKIKTVVAKQSSGTMCHSISSIKVSPTETRDFVFSSAALTDDDAYLDNSSSKGVGEIKVVLEAVKIVTETKSSETYPSESFKREKIHESLMKGLVHQVGYDSKTARPDEPPCQWLHYKSVGKPVTLTFKYRSLDILQASGIAPRPTPPVVEDRPIEISGHQPSEIKTCVEKMTRRSTSSEVKEDIDDESDEDEVNKIIIKSLQTLLLELEKAAKKKKARKNARRISQASTSTKIKEELTTVHGSPSKTVGPTASQENVAHPRKKVKNSHSKAPAEVIDLT